MASQEYVDKVGLRWGGPLTELDPGARGEVKAISRRQNDPAVIARSKFQEDLEKQAFEVYNVKI